MKRLMKLTIGTALVIVMLAGATVAFAQGGPAEDRPNRGDALAFFQQAPDGLQARCGGRGAGGEVTAIGDSSLTVENRRGDSVTVNVTADTSITLVESQSEGSLSDINLGDHIRVHGQRNGDGSVAAQAIHVAPAGDMAGGRVTAVNGERLTVENRAGETTTIVTNSSTEFRLGHDGETGSLADVTTDSGVHAFGELEADGSLTARLVFIGHGGPGKGPRPGNGPAGQ